MSHFWLSSDAIHDSAGGQVISGANIRQGTPDAHPPYRPEIDGLRAIAVLSVVLYHFGVPGLRGGFVGVDVFFVISGFLIGGILWGEARAQGRIALGRFYLRRVRRLAPAFFAMAAVTAIFAAVVLLPFEFREFGKSLIAATVWLSNVLFYRGAGYFDIGNENKPLLHTWSLAVEEQFYIVLPLALVALLALGAPRRVMIGALVLAWGVSLLGCIALTPSAPGAAFYLFPWRAWELLSGVLLAVWGYERRAEWDFHPGLSWGGLGLIAAAVTLTRVDLGFPGWQAVLPVVATLMLLANGAQANAVNRALRARGPVFVGLISYSLYLWHWPVLTLSRYWRDGAGSPAETLGWLMLSVVLAIAAWALIERPARAYLSGRLLVAGSLVAGAAMVVIGAGAYLLNGMPGRFGPEAQVHIAAAGGFVQDWSRCSTDSQGPLAGVETCAIGPEGPPQVLIWGDSHLRAVMDGLALAALETGTPGLIIWHAGCPPLLGLSKAESAATPAEDADCVADTAALRAAIPGMDSLRRLILVGRWAYYAKGSGTGRDAHNTITLAPLPGSGLAGDTQAALYAAAWGLTIAELGGQFEQIAVMRQVPEIAHYDARDIARRMAHGRLSAGEAAGLFTTPDDVIAARMADAEAPIAQLVAEGRITLIDPWPAICPEKCSVMQGGRSWYFDNNHLNRTGALALRGLFFPALTGIAP